MPQPRFARLETRLAAVSVRTFGNVALTDGLQRFPAVLDRNVERLGGFGEMAERRDRLTFDLANAPCLSAGLVLSADPEQYTAEELLAMPCSEWTLDALESDDGLVAVWWVK
jgi:hypothetical protein